MIGKIIGAALGRRLAGENARGRGELIGFIAPAVIKRVSPPLLVLAGAGWAAKKLWNRRRARREAAAA
ncbi:MAG TPA: hypothetical protein VGD66_15025 [Allosphingosinicella sp.]|jgi:hypothetical protein